VIQHRLVPARQPARQQVLDKIRVGVYNDGVPTKEDGDPYDYEWEALYRGTYGIPAPAP
jgi:hypothetical protein